MGLAGLASSGSIKRKEHLAQAIESIEVAFDGTFNRRTHAVHGHPWSHTLMSSLEI